MSIKITSGDMFATLFDVRVNPVNCVGVMGKGLAKRFKKRYPDMFAAYKADCAHGLSIPGKVWLWPELNDEKESDGSRIICFPTKEHWRDNSKYEYIEEGLCDLHRVLKAWVSLHEGTAKLTVAVPALGCGNGGLRWSRVERMIREHLCDLDADISLFEPI